MSRKWDYVLMGQIAKLCVEGLLSAGFNLYVDHEENEEIPIIDSSDASIKEIIDICDDEYLYAKKGKKTGWIFFRMYNEPEEVISDYTINLENFIKPALELAKKYD